MTKRKKLKEKYIRERKGKKSVSFQIDIPYTDGSGNPCHFTETVNSADYEYDTGSALLAARMIRDRALQDISSGKYRQKVPTVRWFYEKSWELIPRSIKTRELHDTRFRQGFVAYADVPLSKVTVADLQKCINDYSMNHSQGETDRLLSMWRYIYRCARILEYDITDITDSIIKPKSKVVVKKRSQSTTNADVEDLLIYILEFNPNGKKKWINYASYYILSIMYYTGCRPAEVLPLTRSDIHDGYISVTKALGSNSTEKDVIIPTKTDGSTRNVPISSELEPILQELLSWSSGDSLFMKPDGVPFSITEFSAYVGRVARKHKMDFHPYMLRHLLSTDLVRNKNVRLAKDIMGHASTGITISYARTSEDEMRQAIEGRTFAEVLPKKRISTQHRTAFQRWYYVQRFALDLRFIMCTVQGGAGQ